MDSNSNNRYIVIDREGMLQILRGLYSFEKSHSILQIVDDILDKFNENLDNTAKIYSSIRETLTQSSKSGKEYVIRVD